MSERVASQASSEQINEPIRELLDSLYRVDSGRILATLIRLVGDFDLAEEAMHEAFAAALSVWPTSGVPDNPRPWLISTARFKAIDSLRRRARFDASQDELVRYLEAQSSSADGSNQNEQDSLEDDRLRLIFTCCHPLLPPEAQVALTLREVCGLTTEEIAKAFLTTPRRNILSASDAGAAHCARQGKNSRGTDSLRGADARGIAGAAGRGAACHLSRV
ncbi:MAG TPA: sigma factor [Candidatus Sulfotelmatobacter sp.]|nr:sigma factor [Candidatus Sulfotelmatobacter sp.]